SATGLRTASRPGSSDSHRVNARLPAGVIEYGWLDRGPGLPSLTYPAWASAGNSRYTWLRVIDQYGPSRFCAAAMSCPPVIGPSCNRPSRAAAVGLIPESAMAHTLPLRGRHVQDFGQVAPLCTVAVRQSA